MFYLGPSYAFPYEYEKYVHLFWPSLSQPVYLSVQIPDRFNAAQHLTFATQRHFTEVTHQEIEDVTEAMKVARMTFLERFSMLHLMPTNSDEDMNAVLGKLSLMGGIRPTFRVRSVAKVREAVRSAIEQGDLIFVPTSEDLRIVVKVMQEDRQKLPAPVVQQHEDPYATIRQMMGKPRRVPSDLGMPSWSAGSTSFTDSQPFDYEPDMPNSDTFDIAKTPNEGDPGTWYTNPGSGQMRLYGDDGKPVVDFDFDHDHGQGVPHAHNWDSGARGVGLPFSLLP